MRIRAYLVAIFILLVVSPFIIQPNGLNNFNEEIQRTSSSHSVSYTEYGAILIEHDDDFSGLGFPGTGDEFSPYVIDDLNITSNLECITIRNTRAYFNITNCYFAPEFEDYTIGIVLENVTNAYIDSNIFVNKTIAIRFDNVTDSRCVENEIIGNLNSGIDLSQCHNCEVELNHIDGNDDHRGTGIVVSSSYFCNITGNEVAHSYTGISIGVSLNCSIANNQLYDFGISSSISGPFYNPTGIKISGSSNMTISANKIYDSPMGGISLENPNSVYCSYNILTGCGFLTLGLTPGIQGFSSIGDLVNNKPILYLWNQTNQNIDGTPYSQIILHESKYCIITGGEFIAASAGIIMMYSTNCSIIDAESSNNPFAGAMQYLSANCSFINITFNSNSLSIGFGFLSACVYLYNSQNATIQNCEISDSDTIGLLIAASPGTMVKDNTFLRNGIYIKSHTMPQVSAYYIIEENNTINGKEYGYFYNETDLTIDGSQYGQILVVNSSSIMVSGGQFDDASVGVSFVNANNCTLEDATVEQNAYTGLEVLYSVNTTIRDTSISENPLGAIGCQSSVSSDFINNTIHGNGVDLPDNQMQPSLLLGLYANAINNTITYNKYGMGFQRNNVTIVNNNISCNGVMGIFGSADYFNITSNRIAGNFLDPVIRPNDSGIYISMGSHGTIRNNSIYSNSGYGVVMGSLSASENMVYWNEIGWNGLGNALDGGTDNLWDDNVATGNAWSDYVGPGTYAIIDSSEDRYPTGFTDVSTPTIVGPADVILESGTLNNALVWNASDNYPGLFVVYQNGTVIANRTWCFKPIEVELDPMVAGVYNLTIVVYDGAGNHISDTVIVTSVDTISPTINSPDDIEYASGQTGNNIVWIGSDVNPVSYEIFKDAVSTKTGVWNSSGESIVYNIDGLSAAVYNYTIVITDIMGFTAADEIIVTVVDGTNPTLDSPDDIEYSEFDEGYFIEWHPDDVNPSTYAIYFDDAILKSGLWNSSTQSISTMVDGLSLGVYNYTLVVTDTYDNIARDEVLVTVIDGYAPILVGALDVTFTEGTTGYNITWSPSDAHPVSYEILFDGSLLRSGLWNSTEESIVVSLDGLTTGPYNYTVILTDIGGNTVSDTVIVTVTEVSTTTTTTTTTTNNTTTTDDSFPPMTLIILSAVAGIFIIFVVILLLRKR